MNEKTHLPEFLILHIVHAKLQVNSNVRVHHWILPVRCSAPVCPVKDLP